MLVSGEKIRKKIKYTGNEELRLANKEIIILKLFNYLKKKKKLFGN